jgi:hypothetical protein
MDLEALERLELHELHQLLGQLGDDVLADLYRRGHVHHLECPGGRGWWPVWEIFDACCERGVLPVD